MKQELVSIIVPVYNSEKYIRETITCILNQSYTNIELIVVNDGSTDNSYSIIEEFSCDSRVHVIHITNHGAPYARNMGETKANGKYIMYFDSDDIMLPNAIETLVSEAEQSDADLVVGNYDIVDYLGRHIPSPDDGYQPGLYSIKDLESYRFISALSPFPNTKLYRKTIIDTYQITFGNTKIAQDFNFYIKYLACSQSIKLISQNICSYRLINGSISHTYNSRIFDIVNCLDDIAGFYSNNKVDSLIIEELWNIRVRSYIGQSYKCVLMKSYRECRKGLKFFYKITKEIYIEHKEVLDKKNTSLIKRLRIRLLLSWLYYSFYKFKSLNRSQ